MKLGVAVVCSILAACSDKQSRGGNAADSSPPAEVTHFGSVHAVMQGEWAPVVSLSEGLRSGTAYGLGALSDLRGEFVAMPGEIWLSHATSTATPDVQRVTASDESAALLVSTNVTAFRKAPIAADVASADVEARVAELARQMGVNVSKPFPFLIEGRLTELHWHVVDGTRVAAGTRPDESAQKRVAAAAEGTIVGFYSESHEGVFTMMGQRTHMHVILRDGSVSGHVESLEIPAGATLSVP
jgi:acetolactate decarboxylase